MSKTFTLKPTKKTIKQLIKAGKYDSVNQDIEPNFNPEPVAAEAKLFEATGSSEKILSKLDADGYRPANLTELLHFGIQYPEEQRRYWIVALGSVWTRRGGSRLVGCLWGDSGHRGLYLYWFGGGWHALYRFLAVRKSELGISESMSLSEPLDSLTLEVSQLTVNGKKYRLVEDD